MELEDDGDFVAVRMEEALIPIAVPSAKGVCPPVMPQHFLRELLYVVPPVRDFDVEVVTEALAVIVTSGDLVRVDGCGDGGGDVWLVDLHKGFSHFMRGAQQVFCKLCEILWSA